ncbi:hypothetical protein THASP1DRAFT_16888 [Thamnocephalis sphaerospora]|uniref:Uncharacterized protein n=1 Tax=Thamnocephalis sphaerospora TaxID=78915 RepID=A0A4V1IWH2_9FUNG|nr:hypothetical protein THASP1DRAFT_16888 [Thamnocephalis sphaerospora]|eukprot:RKP07549.1 hypothetical protein THASP1DRAFT_16888 [Thamnocephalis sphaerospora]
MQLWPALFLSALLAYHAIRKRQLTMSGTATACAVGFGMFYNPSNLFAALLVGFFLSSSQLTKVGRPG